MALEQELIKAADNLNPEVINLLTQAIDRLWTAFWSLLSACTVGFLFLAGWLRSQATKVKGIEDVSEDVDKVLTKVESIEASLVGTLDNRGMIPRHFDLEKRVSDLEKKDGKQ